MTGELLDELAASVTTTRERVALSMGPAPDDTDGAYWIELARFQDWTRWLPAREECVEAIPDWRQV